MQSNGQEPKGGSGAVSAGQHGPWLQPPGGTPRHIPELVISQRDNEQSRVVVKGSRTDDGSQCTVVLIQEPTGHWGIYPHGFDKFGVRLPQAEAVKAAQAMLDGAE